MYLRTLFCFCCLLNPITVFSEWTGIIVNLEDTDTNWLVKGESQESGLNRLSLKMEEKTEAELRVGVSIGQVSVRTKGLTGIDQVDKFEASFFGLTLRQPVYLNDFLNFEGSLDYRFTSGLGLTEADAEEIEWHETGLTLSIGFNLSDIRISPFIHWQKVDGDISTDTGRIIFESDETVSRGLMLDYFIEPFSYIRLNFSEGGSESLMLSFAKVY
jgi:hypothetical protein